MKKSRGSKKMKMSVLPSGQAVKWEKEGQTIQGVYDGCRKVDTKNGEQYIHSFVDGDIIKDVWESKGLAGLHRLPKGTFVRIVFDGVQKLKAGRRMNVFTVEYDSSAKLV